VRRTIRVIVGGAAAAALLLSAAPAATADPPDGTPTVAPPADRSRHIVTLVTGDRVVVAADGTTEYVPAEGREKIGHRQLVDGDDIFIVPTDAVDMLRDGRLDRRLFNISGLIRDGYADTAGLPLIVSGGAAARSAVTGGTRLETIDATASVIAGGDLTDLWESLSGGNARSAKDAKIWLDGKSRIVLDASVPQIGAPEAWAAGYDGTGVTVAILDSGWDPTHPDLVDRVTKAENFTAAPDAVDRNGHGTHVASITAGTGAASGGRYKGVAPGASLIVGKVCDDDGWCLQSDMIAGMEWAAAEGASVVNLSIGGTPSEGDPVVSALERLSTDSGTLFVVAAGNNYGPNSIDSPGVAPSALTVGSVTKQDELSDFSSQGPAFDHTVKPDLVAPGSAITAAQAAGTGPEGEFYATHDGTSMATPHTTGAAALLKQQHPDWTGEQIKDALASSAKGLDALTPYQEGAGRLDVAHGVDQDVYADGSVSFGMFAYPQDQETAVKDVTYTNGGATDVTLDVSLTGGEGFALDSPQVTVPAGGSASVSVSYDPDPAREYGAHATELVATSGSDVVRTAVGAETEAELYTVDFPIALRDGETLDFADVTFWNLDTGERSITWDYRPDGTPYARIAPGNYVFAAAVQTADGGDLPIATLTDMSAEIRSDTAVPVDAAAAGDVTTDILFTEGEEQQAASVSLRVGWSADPHAGIGANASGFFRARLLPGTSNQPVKLDLWQMYTSADGEYYLSETREGPLPDGLALSYEESDLGVVDHVVAGQGGAATTGSLGSGRAGSGIALSRQLPGTFRMYYTPGVWNSDLNLGAWDDDTTEMQEQSHEVVAGQVSTVDWNRAPIGVGFSQDLAVAVNGASGFLYVNLGMFSGPDAAVQSWTTSSQSRLTFADDGETVLDTTYAYTNRFNIPTGLSGEFTLACEMVRDVPWSAVGTKSTVEFIFDGDSSGPRLDADVNLVRLNASGVRDGYASAKLPQVVSLTVDHGLAEDQSATKSLTFEVSYDGGKTWKKVSVKRLGESAVALLRHPSGATSVSTRLSTVDSDGNTSVQTTIASYGLK